MVVMIWLAFITYSEKRGLRMIASCLHVPYITIRHVCIGLYSTKSGFTALQRSIGAWRERLLLSVDVFVTQTGVISQLGNKGRISGWGLAGVTTGFFVQGNLDLQMLVMRNKLVSDGAFFYWWPDPFGEKSVRLYTARSWIMLLVHTYQMHKKRARWFSNLFCSMSPCNGVGYKVVKLAWIK